MSFAHADIGGIVTLVSSTYSVSSLFLPPLGKGSLSFERRGLMKTSHLGLNVPRSLILSIVSVFEFRDLFPSAAEESSSDNG